MEFAGLGPEAADDGQRFADPPPLHGDSMQVIRDALLSQLQKDRLRQEIIMGELAKIERAMALRSAGSHHGTASSSANPERANPAVQFTFNQQQFVPHGRGAVGPERPVGVHEVRDLKTEDGLHAGVRIKSEKTGTADDLVRQCSKTCGGNGKAAGQEKLPASDERKKEPNEVVLPMKPAMKDDLVSACLKSSGSGSDDKASCQKNEARYIWEEFDLDVQPKKTPPAEVKKWSCGICQVEVTCEGNLLQHFAGQKHRVNVVALKAVARAEKARKARQYAGKPGSTWTCKFCPANCTGKSNLDSHLQGKKHHAKIQALLEECKSMTQDLAPQQAESNSNIVTKDEEKPDLVSFCGICQVKCTNPLVRESHVRGKKHQMNLQALKLEAKRLGIIPAKIAKKQQAPLELDCTICQAKCNSESQFHDHCRSMGHQQKIDAMQREGTNVHSSGMETGNKLSTDGSSSNGVSLEGEIEKALYFCKLCDLQCNSKNTLAEHRRGKKHLEKVEKRMLASFCDVCNLQCNSEKMLAHHRTGSKHQANLSGR